MKAACVASVMGATLLVSAAGAYEYGYVKGNDTGGIIPWSCATESVAQEMAGTHCAGYNKYARITSVTRQYGDYIAFACLWTPYVAPYQIPATPVRTTCSTPPQRRIWVPIDTQRAGDDN
jgi:hypothetical protein